MRWIEQDPDKRPIADARLKDSVVAVWAIVAHFRAVGGDVDQVAADYKLPREAVEAALAYFARHKRRIEARVAMNAA